ncbi:helix-turn-helix domain-containing protein [uncultured Kiloniella sp.]|mgnify:CR=1 FL=1|uniref:helix-turn-helix domain-containing protein n=1 Tax=uncultured Kiloniella sp. TaxID=1133091 RepID=UPI00260BF7E1|nr:helix-turn-helix domain-containing protein [uncultured Kiloniella sp.]
MTPIEFKAARERLNLTQTQLGTILNVNPRTVRKWEQEDGTRPPNPIACRVMEWLEAGFVPPEIE